MCVAFLELPRIGAVAKNSFWLLAPRMYRNAVRVCLLMCLLLGLPQVHIASAQADDPDEQFAPSASVLDDPLIRYQAKRGLDLLYNMRFDRAATLFNLVDQRYPEHPIGPFLTALNTWWEILLDLSDESLDEDFFNAMQEVIDRSDRMLDADSESFDAKFFKGAALGFRGRHRSNRGQWYRAARDGQRALSYVLSIAEHKDENIDFGFGQGIYEYFVEAMPEQYPVIRPLMVFFPSGNKENGLEILQRISDDGYYTQTEATYFLLQIFHDFEQDYEQSLYYANKLVDRHPQNPFFRAYKGRVHARWGRWTNVQDTFGNILQRYQENEPGYTDGIAEQALFYLGRAHVARRSFDEALERFHQLEALSSRHEHDTNFRVMGRLYQGIAYDGLGERETAKRRYQEVLEMDDHANAHELAKRYLDRPYQ